MDHQIVQTGQSHPLAAPYLVAQAAAKTGSVVAYASAKRAREAKR